VNLVFIHYYFGAAFAYAIKTPSFPFAMVREDTNLGNLKVVMGIYLAAQSIQPHKSATQVKRPDGSFAGHIKKQPIFTAFNTYTTL
jgi:hypothetical protein